MKKSIDYKLLKRSSLFAVSAISVSSLAFLLFFFPYSEVTAIRDCLTLNYDIPMFFVSGVFSTSVLILIILLIVHAVISSKSKTIESADLQTDSGSNDLLDNAGDIKKALSDFREFIKANKDISLTPDNVYDVVSGLLGGQCKELAAVASCDKDSFAKFSESMLKQLSVVIEGYRLCEAFNTAHKENKECAFGESARQLLPEFAQSMCEASVDAVKYKESRAFFQTMYDLFVEDFFKNRKTNKSIGWFYGHVLNIAFHSADYIAYIIRFKSAEQIMYYENYRWLKSGFDKKLVEPYQKNNSLHSTEYSNRLSDWLDKVEVRKTTFLVDKYLIKP